MVPLFFQCDQMSSRFCNIISGRHSFIKFPNKIFAIAHWLLMVVIKTWLPQIWRALELIFFFFTDGKYIENTEENSSSINSQLHKCADGYTLLLWKACGMLKRSHIYQWADSYFHFKNNKWQTLKVDLFLY